MAIVSVDTRKWGALSNNLRLLQRDGFLVVLLIALAASGYGQANKKPSAAERVDIELMTANEVKDAIAAGKTTALVYNGGTETRGPQAVIGGHTLVAHAKVVAIARELGNALAAPVLPFSPNNATPDLPGTIGITAETFKEVNKEVAEQLIRNGFKNVVLMGDHGGGQKELGELAAELDAQYGPQGIRVVYCGDAYKKSNDDYDKWIASKGLSPGGHASINDTSEMMYLEPASDAWVRRDKLTEAVEQSAPSTAVSTTAVAAAPGERVHLRHSANGVSGDGRLSTAEVGKYGYDIHVSEAVAQIRGLLAPASPAK